MECGRRRRLGVSRTGGSRNECVTRALAGAKRDSSRSAGTRVLRPAVGPPVALPSVITLGELVVRGSEEIVAADVRQGAITSQSIGVDELAVLLRTVPEGSEQRDYEAAIVDDNVLGLRTASSREWRFQTLRRLYGLTPGSVLFRALRDLWGEPEAQPLLAGLCAMTRDTIFRATAGLIVTLAPGDDVASDAFVEPIEKRFPGAYQAKTISTIAQKAYASWGQTGHLSEAEAGIRVRTRAECHPENASYALMLGHLQGLRGEALFDTIWTQVLDRTRSELDDLAFAASQRGMIEYRSAGGVVEVGFRELLRPMEGELL